MLRTYVGREPRELILKGQIRRGDVRTITAALMLVDLRDFTPMSDLLAPNAVISYVNIWPVPGRRQSKAHYASFEV
jgi:adenylate cyclase